MSAQLEYWNQKHQKYAQKDWIDKPSLFAQWVVQYFPKQGEILDLGAGHGQDSRFFAEKGYGVVATDFSGAALEFMRQKLSVNLETKMHIQYLDLTGAFPFEDKSFDAVYSHLSVHYFDKQITKQIFSEIYRVLRPEGIVTILVNSTNDPECGTGRKLEDNYFELAPGEIKRFFNLESMRKYTAGFETLVLDNQGTTLKDSAKGIFNLIRFVGMKPLTKKQ